MIKKIIFLIFFGFIHKEIISYEYKIGFGGNYQFKKINISVNLGYKNLEIYYLVNSFIKLEYQMEEFISYYYDINLPYLNKIVFYPSIKFNYFNDLGLSSVLVLRMYEFGINTEIHSVENFTIRIGSFLNLDLRKIDFAFNGQIVYKF